MSNDQEGWLTVTTIYLQRKNILSCYSELPEHDDNKKQTKPLVGFIIVLKISIFSIGNRYPLLPLAWIGLNHCPALGKHYPWGVTDRVTSSQKFEPCELGK